MCTYTTHIRVCGRCAGEDTVLISEQLCAVAKASGIFGSCLEGIYSQRDATGYQCWQCKESSVRVAVVAVPATTAAAASSFGMAGRRRKTVDGMAYAHGRRTSRSGRSW
ncbi:10f7d617-68fd-451b-8c19-636839144dfb [Thermothielavioides terrestris]|uniref:10f7d617-68fd-451b-8c19-636839144dfb n=1 Tax=Thermothielavioides terrestris TaxID=2587410 RepID=A0A446BQ98_9PEZI|nr:10f7d617-68fd-451b-8c19-636839144dfb [Thermothielavioides terrestris]